jgi:hypothetical protein
VEVLGWSLRQDQLHLLLVLPDGQSLIDTGFMDRFKNISQPSAGRNHRSTSSARPLLHSRTFVDALLRRREASGDEALQSGGEEWKGGATEPAPVRRAAQRQRGGLKHTRRQTKGAVVATLARPIVQVALGARVERRFT